MKQTGERPLKDSTPAALLALHDAGYREIRARITSGVVLDVGCGVGDESIRLAVGDSVVLGIDYDADTAAMARGNGVHATCADGSILPLRTASIDAVCSSHIIEHFVDPEPHVAEVARVTKDDGAVFFLTPNEPADFENPFHVHLFTPSSLQTMLRKHFADVEVMGLDGDDIVHADFDTRRQTGKRLLALDVFGLRKKLPRSWYIALHAFGRRVVYPFTNRHTSDGPAITEKNYFVTPILSDKTLVLFAIAKRPVRSR